ncbi:MAG: hypothetical protein HKO73_04200 [Woeseiaceae bacterium]|nr:hypothetical protein [Woeseiaceae bacterium]
MSAENPNTLGPAGTGTQTGIEALSIIDFVMILKRRRYVFLLPAIAVALFVTFYALSLPDSYSSVAKILIEDQQIPRDAAGAPMMNIARQQIELVRERLFTVKNIKGVIEKYGVYRPTDRKGNIIPDSVLADRFRRRTNLVMGGSTEENAPAAARRDQVIAVSFTLAFEHGNRRIAQKVTEELVTLFLSENQRSSASGVNEISALLVQAIDEAEEELRQAEAQVAAFKERNAGALPELQQFNRNTLDRNERQLSDLDLRIQQLRQRQLQLSSQIALLSPSAPVRLPTGEVVMSDAERLKSLLVDFRRKSSIYESGHPDLVRLEREIESLKRTVGGAQSYPVIQEQLRQERERLTGLRGRYSADHPDVKYSEAAVANLEAQLAATNPRESTQNEAADNPTYVLLKTQIQANDLELQGAYSKRAELQAKIAEYEALIRRAPQIELRYEALLRTAENARTKYMELEGRLRAADVAADVEQEIAMQRFVLIEPPEIPTKPVPKNQPAIIFLGLILAGIVGAAIATLAEFVDKSIRSSRKLARLVGTPPLAVIPYLDNSADVAQARSRRRMIIVAFLAGTALSVAYAIYFL